MEKLVDLRLRSWHKHRRLTVLRNIAMSFPFISIRGLH